MSRMRCIRAFAFIKLAIFAILATLKKNKNIIE